MLYRYRLSKPFAAMSVLSVAAALGACNNNDVNCLDAEHAPYYQQGVTNAQTQMEADYDAGHAAGLALPQSAGETDGYNASYTNAYNAAYTPAYNVAYTPARADGVLVGQADQVSCTNGATAGTLDGYDDGYEAGRLRGSQDGDANGAADGFAQGANEGYDAGVADGYAPGFDDGVLYCQLYGINQEEIDQCTARGYSDTYVSNRYQQGLAAGRAANPNYQAGYLIGQSNGNTAGQSAGAIAGTAAGDDDGYVDGVQVGRQNAYNNCYNLAYNNNVGDGDQDGYDSTYNTYYQAARTEFYTVGYNDDIDGYGYLSFDEEATVIGGSGGIYAGWYDGFGDGFFYGCGYHLAAGETNSTDATAQELLRMPRPYGRDANGALLVQGQNRSSFSVAPSGRVMRGVFAQPERSFLTNETRSSIEQAINGLRSELLRSNREANRIAN